MSSETKRYRTIAFAILFFLIITTFFYYLIVGTMPKYSNASSGGKVRDADLSKEFICLDSSMAEEYKGQLYESEDFAEGIPKEGDPDAKYATHRIVLSLKKGITYGITGQTATYAQKVYVNGELLSSVGVISTDEEKFVPKTDLYTVYFTPAEEETEIIIQHAWFNHQSGAFHKIYLAEAPVIERMERNQTMCDGVIVGTLLAMSIFFLGIFLFYLAQKSMLWFSLSCFCAAANYLLYESKQIMVFFPNLSWYVAHKTEHLTNIYYLLFILLFAFSMLKVKAKRWFSVLSFTLLAILTGYYVLVPSVVYTKYAVAVSACMILYAWFAAGVLFYQSMKEKKFTKGNNLIAYFSVVLTLIVYVIEGVTYFSYIFYLRSYAMILLAFCNAIVLTMQFSETERNLQEARVKEQEIARENEMLERMNSLKNDFMRNIAHEMKTPLTVMSGYAQLTERQMEKDAVNEETTENLHTIAKEAGRLSDMVTKLLDVTYQSANIYEISSFPCAELLEDAAAVCRPILAKNGNRLEIICESEKKILANKEALLQVLINLAVNSGKHTKNGSITFLTRDKKEEDDIIEFVIADNGTGISAAALPHIFERGYSTDGSNGLGLAICRDIITSMNGTIAVKSTGQNGTTVIFTVSADKRGNRES